MPAPSIPSPTPIPRALAEVATTGAYDDLSGLPTLSKVATTGAYDDLSGLPTIPVVAGAIEAAASSGATLTPAGFAAFFASLPTSAPSTSGLPWNNAGGLAFS